MLATPLLVRLTNLCLPFIYYFLCPTFPYIISLTTTSGSFLPALYTSPPVLTCSAPPLMPHLSACLFPSRVGSACLSAYPALLCLPSRLSRLPSCPYTTPEQKNAHVQPTVPLHWAVSTVHITLYTCTHQAVHMYTQNTAHFTNTHATPFSCIVLIRLYTCTVHTLYTACIYNVNSCVSYRKHVTVLYNSRRPQNVFQMMLNINGRKSVSFSTTSIAATRINVTAITSISILSPLGLSLLPLQLLSLPPTPLLSLTFPLLS